MNSPISLVEYYKQKAKYAYENGSAITSKCANEIENEIRNGKFWRR